MKISDINFNTRSRGQSEISIEWESDNITVLVFGSSFPIQVQEYYTSALNELFRQHTDIKSFDELFGLFTWWFTRSGLETPLMVATFNTAERKRIGHRIRELRTEKRMEAKQLSALIGIDAANLSRIEQGKTSAGLDTLSKIANALGYRLDFVN